MMYPNNGQPCGGSACDGQVDICAECHHAYLEAQWQEQQRNEIGPR